MNSKEEKNKTSQLVLKALEVNGFTNYQRLTLTALTNEVKNNSEK